MSSQTKMFTLECWFFFFRFFLLTNPFQMSIKFECDSTIRKKFRSLKRGSRICSLSHELELFCIGSISNWILLLYLYFFNK